MQKAVGGLLVSALVLASGMFVTPAAGDDAPKPTKVEERDEGSVLVTAETPGRSGTEESGSPRRVSTGPLWTFWVLNSIDGPLCRQRVSTRSETRANQIRPFATTSTAYPFCPTQPPDDESVVPDDLARTFWEARILPSPVLVVEPDYAFTGKTVYLQIGGDRSKRFDVDNPLGDDVTIDATSTYVVDWGDGSPVSATSSQGGPWPGGDVTHVYTDVRPTTMIKVSQRWTAAWSAGAVGGQLGNLGTSATLGLPVTQLQAVRNS